MEPSAHVQKNEHTWPCAFTLAYTCVHQATPGGGVSVSGVAVLFKEEDLLPHPFGTIQKRISQKKGNHAISEADVLADRSGCIQHASPSMMSPTLMRC